LLPQLCFSSLFSTRPPPTPTLFPYNDALPIFADIRVGVNGEQFVTAGEAISSQIKSVQEGEIVSLQDVIRMLAYFLDSKGVAGRSEEHTSELQSRFDLVCRLLLEKKKKEVA